MTEAGFVSGEVLCNNADERDYENSTLGTRPVPGRNRAAQQEAVGGPQAS